MSFSIGEAADRSDVSVHTLRYYERIALLGRVPRNNAGRREYGPDDLDWISLLCCLRSSGMKITDMKTFSDLVRTGSSLPARIELLDRHRARVVSDIRRLQNTIDVIDEKLTRYRSVEAQAASSWRPSIAAGRSEG